MTEKFFVRADGSWIGAYTGHINADGEYVVETPPDGIEVPSAPERASQVWDFETKTFSPLE